MSKLNAIVIPAFNPDVRLNGYVAELQKSMSFEMIVVVNDGSGASCSSIFEKLSQDSVIVLHHSQNRGKGFALKTGYEWINKNHPEIQGIITADSDGQHTVEDCLKLADEIQENTLILGARDFNLPNIPPKSRGGNKVTSVIFGLFYGQYLQDTQTGLRAFPASLLPFMLSIEGDRYEYEMNVLIACARARIPMVSVPIETVYENNNKGTHFNPIKDSIRIYKVIFWNFFKFMESSLISMLIDQGLFNLLNIVAFNNGVAKAGEKILLSTVIARVVSACVNFTLNRNLVFGKDSEIKKSFGRYLILCISIMFLSAVGTWMLSRIMSSMGAKIITDTLLYFVSYRVQQNWVFKKSM